MGIVDRVKIPLTLVDRIGDDGLHSELESEKRRLALPLEGSIPEPEPSPEGTESDLIPFTL